MFSATRKAALSDIEWDAKSLEYIEAWSYSDVAKKTPQYCRDGVLKKGKCMDWLHRRGSFAVPNEVTTNKTPSNGGLRLLICDRTSLFPPGLAMTKDDFLEAEKVLGLHPASLPSFLLANGTHSRFLTRDDEQKISKIDFILKAPQKYEIANYGLSVSFDATTNWTTAFLYGESVTDIAWKAMGRNNKQNKNQDGSWAYKSPRTQILKLLRTSTLPWNHPFLLPCALMADHLARMKAFCEGELTKDVMDIERELGVVRVGQRSEHGMSGLWPHFRPPQEDAAWTNALLDRPTIMNSMTVRINTQYTKVIFTKRSPSWNLEASEFLLKLWNNQLKAAYGSNGISTTLDGFLSESLEYNMDIAKSMKDHVDNLQTRMDLQLNVLYSFVAQRDNRLNTRIAKSSGRDSVSMKILAFISAFFIPATYVATLFSMQGLFNWVPTGGSDAGGDVDIVNKKFWIYWAISAPLTVLTLGGWALWWRYEMKRYPKDETENEQLPNAPAGFAKQIMETLGLQTNTPSHVPPEAEKRRQWVFGGRRRKSKMGVDGNPSALSMEVGDTEVGCLRSHDVSPLTMRMLSTKIPPSDQV